MCGLPAMPWQDVCQSICPSVTRQYSVETVTHIIEHFSSSGSHTILVFGYQTGWQYSDVDSPNGGVECKGV